MVHLHNECPAIQVHMEFFIAIYDGQEFSLNVGIVGLSVCEGFAGKFAMGCPSWMMQAPSPLSEASHWRVTSLVQS